MPEVTRRSALSTACLLGGAVPTFADQATTQETKQDTEKTDKDFVLEAGLTEDEAECWSKVAEAAGALLQLPELHPMDKHEIASAIHIVQNKLLSRPTYRKYLAAAKQAREGTPRPQ
ncbi:MAG: hypothetical protein AAFX06_31135 [Planctomycetota bacterium]